MPFTVPGHASPSGPQPTRLNRTAAPANREHGNSRHPRLRQRDRRRRPHRPGAAPGGDADPHPGVGRHRRGRAGGAAGGHGLFAAHQRPQGAVQQPQREGRRGRHRQARPDGRGLQVRRRRRQHPGAGFACVRTAHEAQRRRRQQGFDQRLRTAGRQQQLRPERRPAARAAQAGARRRADTHHPVAGVGAGRTRDAGHATGQRLLPGTAEAHRVGDGADAPRPHARARPDRRHRAPGGVQRARTEHQGRERGRRQRRAAVAAGRPQRRAGLRLGPAALPEGGGEQPPQARDGTAGAGGRAREPACHGHRRGRLLAGRIHRRGIQAQPGRCTGRRARHPHRRVEPGRPVQAQRCAGRGQQPAAGAGHGARSTARRPRCRAPRAVVPPAPTGAKRKPTTPSTAWCA